MKWQRFCFIAALLYSGTNYAEDLAQVYQLAIDNDPTLQAAYAELNANKQALPEAVARMLPNFYGSYQTQGWNTNDPFQAFNFNTRNYGLNLTLPLFHSELWAQLEQARHAVKAAVASYLSTNQALAYQVAEQYFNILSAKDDLIFAESNRDAFAKKLDQAEHRFEVGLIAVTDVEDAKARFDRAVADVIRTKASLDNEYEKLRKIVGIPICEVVPLTNTTEVPLNPPAPNEPESWVETANQLSFEMVTATEKAAQYKAAIGAQAAGHLPTVDLQGLVGREKQFGGPFPINYFQFQKALTVNITVPIFSGGSVLYKTREAVARYDQALKQLEAQQRLTDSNVRQSFRDVIAGISSIAALAQVVVSNQNALEATQAAYEAGTRTMVDLLNAQTNVFSAQRDHAKARYKYLLDGLRLKQASGVLTADDLFAINELLLGRPCPVSAEQ